MDFLSNLGRFEDKYQTDYPEGVAMNGHMNECSGKQPAPGRVKQTLAWFSDQLREYPSLFNETTGPKDILSGMTAVAQHRFQTNRHEIMSKQDQAIVVDFINWVGTEWGIDWDMYTPDLSAPLSTILT